MAREEKRPSGRKPSGEKSFRGKSTTSASGRSSAGSRNTTSRFKKEGDSFSRPKRASSSDASGPTKSYRGAGEFKKSFGDKPFGKKTYGDKPKRAYGGSSEGSFSSRPKREGGYGKESDGENKPRFGDKNKFGEKKSFGDKPSFGRKSFGASKSFDYKPKRSFGGESSNEGGAKRAYGKKPFGDKTTGSRPKFEFNKEASGEFKPRFDSKKTFGDKPSYGDRPKRAFGEKDENREESRSFGRRPFGDKNQESSETRRPFGKKSVDDDVEKRPFERRNQDFKKSNSERDSKFADKKKFDDKPKKSYFKKAAFGDDRAKKSVTGFEDFKFEKAQKSEDDFIASDFEKAAKYADDAPKADGKRKSKPVFTESVSDSKEGIRLNKYIANSGICSRREADVLISQGLITVNGNPVTELGVVVKRNDIVKYDGRTLNPEQNVYLLLNKPKDFITTTNDPQERRTVMNLVANACKERIYPVGRLDRNTTGLLLFTNDGELAEKLTHPSNQVKKIYQVEVDRPITPEDAQLMLDGLYFEEGRATLDSMAVLDESRKVIGLEIHIGWNRIVRRIFEAKGYDVVRLDRVLYAGLTKKDLPRGEWRFLTEKEVIALKFPQRT